jgi:hypothetical protein
LKKRIKYQALLNWPLALKLQEQKNVATLSPASFLPTLWQVTDLLSPELMACSTACCTSSPSAQVKVILPIAFLKKFPSIFTINMLTEGFLLYKADMHNTPVLASAAIESTAKYNEPKGFLLNHL